MMRVTTTLVLGFMIASPCYGIEIEKNAPYAVELWKGKPGTVRIECAIALQGWIKPPVFLEFGPPKSPTGRVPVETSVEDGYIHLDFTLPAASIAECRITAEFTEQEPGAPKITIGPIGAGAHKRNIDLPLKGFLPAKKSK